MLYGTTQSGGASPSHGTVFSLDPTNGAETVLLSLGHHLDGAHPYAGLINVNGTLHLTAIVTIGLCLRKNPRLVHRRG
jgi:uncharacterized repeat protein (TIGR03803 family)